MISKNPILTWHLHITGQVQGVGFRPTIYRIAQNYNLVGQVKNTCDGLHVIFNASKACAKSVKEDICKNSLPSLARITKINFREIGLQEFDTFSIINSGDVSMTDMVLTPDVALCEYCIDELSDKDGRRRSYAFNSCSTCGPRYSIVDRLPYDRVNTKMSPFEMCEDCITEYNAPLNRRYYAQTISCPACTINLSLYRTKDKMTVSGNTDILNQIPKLWSAGNIIAIKGIGGYLLTCDAEQEDVIRRLRRQKNRPTKPFAVMCPDLSSLDQFGISHVAKEMLTSHVSPIVLIPKNEKNYISKGICDDQESIGMMLPYAPIYKVLLNQFNGPIIATSGNVSNAPITFRDEEAIEHLSEVADFIVINDRDITIPQDDSVVKFSEVHAQKIIIRRSRGLAPSYINPELKLENESILATGAQLKSSFTLYQSPNVYVSQYLGDLDNFDTMSNYEHCMFHLIDLLKIRPNRILSDAHPGYASTIYADRLAEKWNVPIHKVQHHKAHFCAILGEHNLINHKEPILGVIWDGSGLGDDEAIWGSEFFIYKNQQLDRCAHLSYFDLLIGDKMAKEPRLSALSLANDLPEAHIVLKSKFSDAEWKIYSKVLKDRDHIRSSSMGRLFDAVSSIIVNLDVQTFEGEAAIMLEAIARSYVRSHGIGSVKESYFQTSPQEVNLQARVIIKSILLDMFNGADKGLIAARFHLTLIEWIAAVAETQDCKKIAFSGGVFQNSLLVDLAIEHLSESHEIYWHQQLSPNDENISFGQLIYHQINIKKSEND